MLVEFLPRAALRGCAAPLCPWAVMWLALRADERASETINNKRWTILHVSHTSPLRAAIELVRSPRVGRICGNGDHALNRSTRGKMNHPLKEVPPLDLGGMG
jgi:hypothetical protein